jgi:hypothetical protein
MTTTEPREKAPYRLPRAARRVGYVAVIAINFVGLWIVHNLLDWAWPPFLTENFEQLLWLIDLSIAANIAISVVFLWFDPAWFKAATQVVVNVIGLILTVKTLQVFPFDFSPYDFNWEAVARGFLILGIVVTAIGIISELVKLARAAGEA